MRGGSPCWLTAGAALPNDRSARPRCVCAPAATAFRVEQSSPSGIYLGQPFALERLARRSETINPLALLADCARPASRRRLFASSSGTKIMSAGCRL